tara:strand:- start:2405 stop:2656 length:252 start_codon:yes stop_codon:yes gene_type:complete
MKNNTISEQVLNEYLALIGDLDTRQAKAIKFVEDDIRHWCEQTDISNAKWDDCLYWMTGFTTSVFDCTEFETIFNYVAEDYYF